MATTLDGNKRGSHFVLGNNPSKK